LQSPGKNLSPHSSPTEATKPLLIGARMSQTPPLLTPKKNRHPPTSIRAQRQTRRGVTKHVGSDGGRRDDGWGSGVSHTKQGPEGERDGDGAGEGARAGRGASGLVDGVLPHIVDGHCPGQAMGETHWLRGLGFGRWSLRTHAHTPCGGSWLWFEMTPCIIKLNQQSFFGLRLGYGKGGLPELEGKRGHCLGRRHLAGSVATTPLPAASLTGREGNRGPRGGDGQGAGRGFEIEGGLWRIISGWGSQRCGGGGTRNIHWHRHSPDVLAATMRRAAFPMAGNA